MAPVFVISPRIDTGTKLSEFGQTTDSFWMWIVGAFILISVTITSLNCACCKKKSQNKKDEIAIATNVEDVGKTEEKKMASGSGKSDTEHDAVGSSTGALFTMTRESMSKPKDLTKNQVNIKSTPKSDSGSILGGKLLTKTPVSSQQAPANTLQMAPAFDDLVLEKMP